MMKKIYRYSFIFLCALAITFDSLILDIIGALGYYTVGFFDGSEEDKEY